MTRDEALKILRKDSLSNLMEYYSSEELQDAIDTIVSQPSIPTIKGWIARDDSGRLGLYDQKPTRKTELGAFSGIAHSWVIGDTWIGRFSLDRIVKTPFPELKWEDEPIEVELQIKRI